VKGLGFLTVLIKIVSTDKPVSYPKESDKLIQCQAPHVYPKSMMIPHCLMYQNSIFQLPGQNISLESALKEHNVSSRNVIAAEVLIIKSSENIEHLINMTPCSHCKVF
jgi:hypothetical protein